MASNVTSNILSMKQDASLITNKEIIKKTRFIDKRSKHQIMRLDRDDFCNRLEINRLDKILREEKYDACIISDYNKGFLSREVIEKIIDKLPRPLFVDTKKTDLSVFSNCTIKINEQERKVAYGLPSDSEIIITQGSRGALYEGQNYFTKTCDIIDVCGAGDTFLAALAVHFCQFGALTKAIQYANLCSRITVQKSGVHSVSLDEVEREANEKY